MSLTLGRSGKGKAVDTVKLSQGCGEDERINKQSAEIFRDVKVPGMTL